VPTHGSAAFPSQPRGTVRGRRRHAPCDDQRQAPRPTSRRTSRGAPGLYRTFGNSTAEVGHAIAAFRPAMNIHQLFVEFFEAFRTSRGLKRQVGSQRCYTATPTHQVPQADAATRCCSGLVTDAQQTALTCLPHGGRWAKSSHVSPLAISRMRPRVNQLRCDGCPVSRPACGRLGYVRCGILWGHTPLFRTDAIRTAGVSRPPD
jgi:hypothetical protein